MSSTLLSELHARGLHVELAGDRIRTLGPRGALTPELIDQVRAERSGLLQVLAAEHPQAAPPAGVVLDELERAGFQVEVVPAGLRVWDVRRRRSCAVRGEFHMPSGLFFDLVRKKDDVRALLEFETPPGSGCEER